MSVVSDPGNDGCSELRGQGFDVDGETRVGTEIRSWPVKENVISAVGSMAEKTDGEGKSQQLQETRSTANPDQGYRERQPRKNGKVDRREREVKVIATIGRNG